LRFFCLSCFPWIFMFIPGSHSHSWVCSLQRYLSLSDDGSYFSLSKTSVS
jgi:hypothetical protein